MERKGQSKKNGRFFGSWQESYGTLYGLKMKESLSYFKVAQCGDRAATGELRIIGVEGRFPQAGFPGQARRAARLRLGQ